MILKKLVISDSVERNIGFFNVWETINFASESNLIKLKIDLKARDGAIRRANQVFNDFLATQPYFNGEV